MWKEEFSCLIFTVQLVTGTSEAFYLAHYHRPLQPRCVADLEYYGLKAELCTLLGELIVHFADI